MKNMDSKWKFTGATALIFLSLFAASAQGRAQRYSYSDQFPTNPPSISAEPVSVTIVAGQAATFSVTAQGNRLHYQWSRNGIPILGATSASYTTPATTVSDNGAQFTVLVKNWAGTMSSETAILTVISESARLTLSSMALNFGSIEIGSSSSLEVIVTNSGSSNATISSATVSGAGFNVTGLSGIILSPGQSTSVNVTFAPSATGNLGGSVVVASDAANSPTKISLLGAGIQPTKASIIVMPANSTVLPGTQVQFKAIDDLGNDITSSVIWGTSESSIVSITATGLATGLADGVVTISATK